MGAVVGCSGPDPQALGAPLPSPVGATPGGPKLSDTPAGYIPQTPFALTSQSVLSEDYFLVDNHQIDPKKDKVVAYSRADGEVEAMVLQDGVVKQVYRDPTQPGGWKVYPLPEAQGVSDMVAGINNRSARRPSGVSGLTVYWTTSRQPDKLMVATETAAGVNGTNPTFDTPTPYDWNTNAGALHLSLNADNSLLAAAIVPSSAKGKTDGGLCYVAGNGANPDRGYLTGFEFWVDPSLGANLPYGLEIDWSAIIAEPNSMGTGDTLMLYLPTFAYSQQNDGRQLQIWYAFTPDGQAPAPLVAKDWYKSGPLGNRTQPGAPPSKGGIISVEFLTVLGTKYEPTAVVRTLESDGQGLWVLTRTDNTNKWAWVQLALPNPKSPTRLATAPRPAPADGTAAHTLLDLFVVSGNAVSVIRQIPQGSALADGTNPAYCPVIPLQTDVAQMTSQLGISAGNELMLVDTDGNLRSMAKDPVSGAWIDSAVHIPASELQENSSYRVTLTLADTSWNAAIPGHDLDITASTPAVAMIEGPTPRSVLLGDSPVTVATDATGQVMIALLADGLSAPKLTITSDGLPKAATVLPSEDVNTYLQGGTGMNFLPPMDASTLTNAKTADGQTVAPGAAANPSDTADQVTKMKQVATLGAQGDAIGRLSSTVGRIDGRPITHGKRHRPVGGAGATTLGSSIDHWAHDVFHAIKQGAASVTNVTVDLEQKIVTISVDIAGWVDNAVVVAVQSIEDAAHVLHALFNKLKADIGVAIKWLRALVGSLLKDSALVAQEFSTLLGETLDFVGGSVDALKSAADNWIGSERSKVHDIFNKTAAAYPAGATVSTMGDYKPASFGRSLRMKSTRQLRTGDDDLSPQPHGDWFLNKVKHAIAGSLNVPDMSGRSYSQIALDLRNGSANKAAKLQTDCELFVTGFLMHNVLHPGDGGGLSVRNLLAEVGKLIDSSFDFLESILDSLFEMVAALSEAIKSILATPIGNAGIVGKLLTLAGLGKYEIGSVAAMILAFPATLTYKLVNGASSHPFDYLPDGLHTKVGASPEADRALQQTAASVMGVWALLDVIGSGLEANGAAIPMLTPAVDTVAPIVLAAIAPPFTTGGLPDWRAMGDGQDAAALTSWLFALFPAYIDGMGIYAEHAKVFGPQTEDATHHYEENEAFNLWAKTACGVLSLVTGIVSANTGKNAGGKDFAIPVLNNLPNITAFCNVKAIEENTEAISVVVGTAVGFAGGVVGAAMYGSA